MILSAAPRRIVRDIRIMVPLCIVLICGSFAAAAFLQLRLTRAHALDQAAAFEQRRANDIAAVAGTSLDRLALAGMRFAGDPGIPVAQSLRDIAVFDADGQLLASLRRGQEQAPRLTGSRMLVPGGAAFRDGAKIIVMKFDMSALVPSAMMRGAALTDAAGLPRALGPQWRDGVRLAADVPGWPLMAQTAIDEDSALADWAGAVPLFLFVILGPAIAGGWLAALFVGSFERQARAARALRNLRSVRPVEARLLVRLAQAERGAAEALRAKSEFIAHMSHELRTPLNAVIGFSEIIAEGFYGPPGHPKYREYARDITQAGRELHDKIGDILEFANIEAGRYPLALERVDLAALAQTCIDEQQGRAFSRRIALAASFCEPGDVRADARALRRILTNLLDNALTYTATGGTVRLEVRFADGAGTVTVTDSGAGFSDGEKTRVGRAFQRFDRAGAVTGAGLGLAIAMELARRMGGTVGLASLPGQGSAMDVRLPRL